MTPARRWNQSTVSLTGSAPRHRVRSRPGRTMRHRAAGLPVAGEHHVRGRCTPARQLRRQSDPPRVRCHPLRRTVTSTPSPAVASTTSAQRKALTSSGACRP